MTVWLPVVILVLAVAGSWVVARVTARLHPRPCPPSLIFLLDNPFSAGYHRSILTRLELSPGLAVLDAGCGPGLVTIPVARAVAPQGTVVGLDIQEEMLRRAGEAAAEAGLTNIRFLRAGLGEGKLPPSHFDRALLVTVLGEIPDRLAALREIFASLKPGGFLSITEVLPDPDYLSRKAVKDLLHKTGYRIRNEFGTVFMFTLNAERPRSDQGSAISDR